MECRESVNLQKPVIDIVSISLQRVKDERRKRRHGQRTALGRSWKKGRNISSVYVTKAGESSIIRNTFKDRWSLSRWWKSYQWDKQDKA